MKNLLILGAGTAGTTLVNKLRPKLDRGEWRITIVDSDPDHHYQPGYLFIPFGTYTPDEVIRPKRDFIPDGVDYVEASIERVEPERRVVVLADGAELPYDYLVIATGTHPRPEETPGLEGKEYGKTIQEVSNERQPPTHSITEGADPLATGLHTGDMARVLRHASPCRCRRSPAGEGEGADRSRHRHRRPL